MPPAKPVVPLSSQSSSFVPLPGSLYLSLSLLSPSPRHQDDHCAIQTTRASSSSSAKEGRSKGVVWSVPNSVEADSGQWRRMQCAWLSHGFSALHRRLWPLSLPFLGLNSSFWPPHYSGTLRLRKKMLVSLTHISVQKEKFCKWIQVKRSFILR